MTAEAQRIAIAEACGYTQEESWLDGRDCWSHKDHPPHMGFDAIPDYLNDLNAIDSAVLLTLNIATSQLNWDYTKHLGIATGSSNPAAGAYISTALIHATAAQRCEAFLKTINKWTDDN